MDETEEIILLAKEIISDTDLRSCPVSVLVNKAYRLASLVNDNSIKEWLTYEKFGYNDSEQALVYFEKTGRTYNKETRIGQWGSISTQENDIEAALSEMEVVKNFKPSGTYSIVQFNSQLTQVKNLNARISMHKRIISIVSSSIFDFATKIYYTYKFGERADTLIDQYKKNTIEGITISFPELKDSFEIISKNSTISNKRGWSVAALECRNILISLSTLWMCSSKTYNCRDGEVIKVEKEKNKLIAYIDIKMGTAKEGKARAKKLFGIIHEVFTLGGKSKRDIDEKELSTIIIDIYVFLNDLISYTDLNPIYNET